MQTLRLSLCNSWSPTSDWQARRKHERFAVSNDAPAKIVAWIAIDASRRRPRLGNVIHATS